MLGSLEVERQRRRLVLWHAAALLVHLRERDLGRGIAAIGRGPVPARRLLLVLRRAEPALVQPREPILGVGHAALRRPLVLAHGLREVATLLGVSGGLQHHALPRVRGGRRRAAGDGGSQQDERGR